MMETQDERSMYVITNESKLFGAASMLYEEPLYELAEKIGSDLYILPSSIHEVIAVSADFGSPDEWAEMVYEINMDQVDINDRLSNQVYCYDKDLRTLRLATDTLAGEDIEVTNVEKKSEDTLIQISKDSSHKQRYLKKIIAVLLIAVGVFVITLGIMVCNKLRQPQNYIEAVDPDSVEMKTAELLSGIDGTMMFRYNSMSTCITIRLNL